MLLGVGAVVTGLVFVGTRRCGTMLICDQDEVSTRTVTMAYQQIETARVVPSRESRVLAGHV